MILASRHHISDIIIQHIDTLPKYGKKLSTYVGSHDVYPTMDVKFRAVKLCKLFFLKNKKLVDNIFFSKFVLLPMG